MNQTIAESISLKAKLHCESEDQGHGWPKQPLLLVVTNNRGRRTSYYYHRNQQSETTEGRRSLTIFLLARRASTGCAQQFSTYALTNERGRVVETYQYSAYGTPTIKRNQAELEESRLNNEYLYTGRRLDTELMAGCLKIAYCFSYEPVGQVHGCTLQTGLQYFRNRYYSSTLGRFISRDPIGYVDGMSLYRGYFVVGGLDWSGLLNVGNDQTSQQINPPTYSNIYTSLTGALEGVVSDGDIVSLSSLFNGSSFNGPVSEIVNDISGVWASYREICCEYRIEGYFETAPNPPTVLGVASGVTMNSNGGTTISQQQSSSANWEVGMNVDWSSPTNSSSSSLSNNNASISSTNNSASIQSGVNGSLSESTSSVTNVVSTLNNSTTQTANLFKLKANVVFHGKVVGDCFGTDPTPYSFSADLGNMEWIDDDNTGL